MAEHQQLASIPSGIRAVCVVNGYIVLLGMAVMMTGILELSNALIFSDLAESLPLSEGQLIAVAGFASIGVAVLQFLVLQGIWRVKSWAWPAGLAMFGVQALLLTWILVRVLGSNMPIDIADGTFRVLVPLIAIVASAIYLFDKREWFLEL